MRRDHWESEAKFFDSVARGRAGRLKPTDPATLERYASPGLRKRFAREFRLRLLRPLAGKSVIDVGCGDGRDTVLLAKLGAARVTGVDIAPGAIELARRRAELDGVADRVDFVCAPVETASIPSGSYDIVWCNAILHHLTDNLEVVMRNMVRWARPDGVISFAEPINLNQTLRRLRMLIPVAKGHATPDERPLEPRDLEIIRRHVGALHVRCFGLLGRLDQFILESFNYEKSSPLRRAAVNVTNALDWALLSLPGVSRLGSLAVMWGPPRAAPR
jgi:2-polyprenyl-3-methyl-5-hydroxy-6-metoxy-1,4-benzoquinol methylase